MDKRTILYKDTEGIAKRERLNAEINEMALSILKRFQSITGTSDVLLSDILEDGAEVFKSTFIELNSHLCPINGNESSIFETFTGEKLQDIQAQVNELNNVLNSSKWNFSITEMNTFTPKANTSIFNKYLDQEMVKDYERALSLLEVVKSIREDYPYSGVTHIMRFTPVGWFIHTGLEIEINVHHFSKW